MTEEQLMAIGVVLALLAGYCLWQIGRGIVFCMRLIDADMKYQKALLEEAQRDRSKTHPKEDAMQ